MAIDTISTPAPVFDAVYGKVVLETGQVVTTSVQAVALQKRQEDGVLTIVYSALLIVLLLIYFIRRKGRGGRV